MRSHILFPMLDICKQLSTHLHKIFRCGHMFCFQCWIFASNYPHILLFHWFIFTTFLDAVTYFVLNVGHLQANIHTFYCLIVFKSYMFTTFLDAVTNFISNVGYLQATIHTFYCFRPCFQILYFQCW